MKSIILKSKLAFKSQLLYNVSMSATTPNATAMIHVRLDQNLKIKAAAALDAMGLSFSDAVRLLMTRIAAEQALPFDVRVPNAVTRAAMDEVRRGGLPSVSSVAELMDQLNAED
jgi:DNA-damage-inducible protein J